MDKIKQTFGSWEAPIRNSDMLKDAPGFVFLNAKDYVGICPPGRVCKGEDVLQQLCKVSWPRTQLPFEVSVWPFPTTLRRRYLEPLRYLFSVGLNWICHKSARPYKGTIPLLPLHCEWRIVDDSL